MKDSKFKQFLKKELQRQAQEDLEKAQADERTRDRKMPEDVKAQILENIWRQIEEKE